MKTIDTSTNPIKLSNFFMYLNFSIDRLQFSIVTENNIYDAIPSVEV